MLVETVDGVRRNTLQIQLSLMRDGTWQVHLAQRPGWDGRQSSARYTTEGEAREVLAAIYAKLAPLGELQTSRFGPPPSTPKQTGDARDHKPSW
jgi:hypothetical protein